MALTTLSPLAALSALRDWVELGIGRRYYSSKVADAAHPERISTDASYLQLHVWCPDHGKVVPQADRYDCPYDMPYDPEEDERPEVRVGPRGYDPLKVTDTN